MIRANPFSTGIELSAVVPVYNEEGSLGELHRRVTAVLESLELPYELILVDDGSRDRTPGIIAELCADDPRVRAVHFSRNFGHQAALAAGLQHASGRGVVVLDADLQDPPELIPELVARWREGHQVVYAQRRRREREGVVKRGAAFLFYRALKRITRFEIPADTGDFCLMDRAVVDLLNSMPERNRYVRGLRAWVGFRQTAVPFDRPPRYAGEPKYTFAGSFGLAVNGILALSKFPLRVATYFGLLVSLASFLLGAWYIAQRLIGHVEQVRGWASTVVIVLFLGGVQLLTIGIIGEYLSRIYDEVKQRPLYVVRESVGFEARGVAPSSAEEWEPTRTSLTK
ncbi:MAG TPA: glycosyltransferase family 2 protein [Gemmatimonadaceae bacterium]|nr:glycosyltransferase family 2 protein [Gemmatimonadaceae bacterium]